MTTGSQYISRNQFVGTEGINMMSCLYKQQQVDNPKPQKNKKDQYRSKQ